MSIATLSDKEMQDRIRLGLVRTDDSEHGQDEYDEEWEDFESDDEHCDDPFVHENSGVVEGIDSYSEDDNDCKHPDDLLVSQEEYVIDQNRRSSVDKSTMIDSQKFVDSDMGSDVGRDYTAGISSTLDMKNHLETNKKRPRPSREPSVSAIPEAENESENDSDGESEDDGESDEDEIETVDGTGNNNEDETILDEEVEDNVVAIHDCVNDGDAYYEQRMTE